MMSQRQSGLCSSSINRPNRDQIGALPRRHKQRGVAPVARPSTHMFMPEPRTAASFQVIDCPLSEWRMIASAIPYWRKNSL
jgi:hypothetical protein